jgi:hypothetical protein
MFLALSASFLACGSNNNTTADAPKVADAAHDAGSGSGSGSGNGSAFAITGFANGLYWDSTANALYFTEKVGSAGGNAFCKWTESGGIEVVASLDTITAPNPGQIVKLSDGSFVFPQFSTASGSASLNGNNNGVIQVVGSDATLLLEDGGSDVGLFRSVGLTLGSDGSTIYQSAFIKGSPNTGYILSTELGSGSDTATQTVFAQGNDAMLVGKVIGLVANADGSFILGDQDHNTFWKVSALGALTTFVATYGHPDMLMALPNGDMLDGGGSAVGGRTTAINHIAGSDGTVTPLTFSGFTFTYIAGMAYDAANHRLFVDDQTGGSNDTIDILPYTP